MRCWHPETYLRLRRVDESKSRKSTYGKSRETTKVEVKYRKYKKKMKYHDKTKFSTFSTSGLVKWFCDMLAVRNWIFCQKSAILKNHKICAWKDDTYIAFWEVAKYQGIRGKCRAISEKRWKEERRSEERWKEERRSEEWGKVERVEEELSGTYLKEKRCMS